MNNIVEWIEKEFGKPNVFQQSVVVDPENKTVTIYLEDCSFHAEWIKGEREVVGLYRANDDNRIVGAVLPLKNWNGKLPVEII